MIVTRKAKERGHGDHGWLDSYHTFSFAGYHDPRNMGFRALRVMNEDRVAPGKGFGAHGHMDMEIVTYVLSGSLEHADSMGHRAVLGPGEFQRISAGTGIRHSEFNASSDQPVHFYQIWLLPSQAGIAPSYEQKTFPAAERLGRLRLVASPNAAEGSLLIHQDARIYLATLAPGQDIAHSLAPGRHAWLQVLGGQVIAGGLKLAAGDAIALSDEPRLTISGEVDAEVMVFDLA